MERHPLDLVSLTAGAVFTLTALLALTRAVTITMADLRWIGPGLLVLFGVVLVASSVSRGSRSDASGDAEDAGTGARPDHARHGSVRSED